MKIIKIFIGILLCFGILSAQMVNDGASLVIQSGAILKLTGDLSNLNGGLIDIAGTLDVEGDVINEADIITQNASLIRFSGDQFSSLLSGGATVRNLELEKTNSAGVELQDHLSIVENLNFISGNLILGNFDLNTANTATLTNASSSSYVETNGSGQIRRSRNTSGTFNFTYPVGNTAHYLPFTFSVNQQSAVPMVYSGKVGNFTLGTDVDDEELDYVIDDHLYTLESTGTSTLSAFQVSMDFSSLIPLSFDAQWLRIATYSGIQWDNIGGQLSGNIVTSTESFTLPVTLALAKGIDDLGIPAHLVFQDMVLPGTADTCYAATQTITIAGDGTAYTVQSGAVVSFVAGLNIFVFPNTTFEAGSSVHLYIDDTDTWCVPAQALDIAKLEAAAVPAIPVFNQRAQDQSLFFKAFPNPTSGIITLELSPDEESSHAVIDIVNLRGERLNTKELTGGHQWDLNLTHLPPGVYIIRVIRQKELGFLRIVKQ